MMQLALVLPDTISGWTLASATRSPVYPVSYPDPGPEPIWVFTGVLQSMAHHLL